jgi:hypothetical protein
MAALDAYAQVWEDAKRDLEKAVAAVKDVYDDVVRELAANLNEARQAAASGNTSHTELVVKYDGMSDGMVKVHTCFMKGNLTDEAKIKALDDLNKKRAELRVSMAQWVVDVMTTKGEFPPLGHEKLEVLALLESSWDRILLGASVTKDFWSVHVLELRRSEFGMAEKVVGADGVGTSAVGALAAAGVDAYWLSDEERELSHLSGLQIDTGAGAFERLKYHKKTTVRVTFTAFKDITQAVKTEYAESPLRSNVDSPYHVAEEDDDWKLKTAFPRSDGVLLGQTWVQCAHLFATELERVVKHVLTKSNTETDVLPVNALASFTMVRVTSAWNDCIGKADAILEEKGHLLSKADHAALKDNNENWLEERAINLLPWHDRVEVLDSTLRAMANFLRAAMHEVDTFYGKDIVAEASQGGSSTLLRGLATLRENASEWTRNGPPPEGGGSLASSAEYVLEYSKMFACGVFWPTSLLKTSDDAPFTTMRIHKPVAPYAHGAEWLGEKRSFYSVISTTRGATKFETTTQVRPDARSKAAERFHDHMDAMMTALVNASMGQANTSEGGQLWAVAKLLVSSASVASAGTLFALLFERTNEKANDVSMKFNAIVNQYNVKSAWMTQADTRENKVSSRVVKIVEAVKSTLEAAVVAKEHLETLKIQGVYVKDDDAVEQMKERSVLDANKVESMVKKAYRVAVALAADVWLEPTVLYDDQKQRALDHIAKELEKHAATVALVREDSGDESSFVDLFKGVVEKETTNREKKAAAAERADKIAKHQDAIYMARQLAEHAAEQMEKAEEELKAKMKKAEEELKAKMKKAEEELKAKMVAAENDLQAKRQKLEQAIASAVADSVGDELSLS